MPRRVNVRRKESIQLYIKGEGSFHSNNSDFSIFITPTFLLRSSFESYLHGSSFPIFFSTGIGSLIPVCNHNFYSPFIDCCLNSVVSKTWGESGMEGSPLWFNTLFFRCVRKKGEACLLPSLFLGGVR